jgi:transcriptional/translational regulatory protein YebC/TACO1
VEDGELELLTDPTELEKTRRALLDLGISIVSAEITMIPKTPMELSPEQTAQVMRLVERLEDLDDVTRVHTNVHLTEASMAQFA